MPRMSFSNTMRRYYLVAEGIEKERSFDIQATFIDPDTPSSYGFEILLGEGSRRVRLGIASHLRRREQKCTDDNGL